jgi:hypothetical protein
MNQEDIKIRAARAEQLLEDETLGGALVAMVEEAWRQASVVSLANPDECIAACARIQAVDGFKDGLKSWVTAGKAAERKPFKVA